MTGFESAESDVVEGSGEGSSVTSFALPVSFLVLPANWPFRSATSLDSTIEDDLSGIFMSSV